jgi:ketosteroid isomerase-like protein
VDYQLDFEEVKVLGDYAYEWGFIRGAMRPRVGGETQHLSYKVMRILAKQPAGEWKVHRTIWNENPAETAAQP